MPPKKNIVISAINFFEGGPLSLLNDCLTYLNSSNFNDKYQIIALVNKKILFDHSIYSNIKFIEFPKSRKTYLIRLYYEYFYFKVLAKKLNPTLWLSLHDITPNIGNITQAVYCHNPSIFNKLNLSDLFIQPKQFYFRLFYKYLYSINLKKNKNVIVQQNWIGKEFTKIFSLDSKKIIIAPPQVSFIKVNNSNNFKKDINFKIFFYPTFPRPFKNIKIICESVILLNNKGITNFKVIITLDGTENTYSKKILKKYKHLNNIEFIGIQPRSEIYEFYANADCLIFPSKLETWGLPLSEFKQYNKPILVSNLPYAIETIGNYDKACFFNPDIDSELAHHMFNFILNDKLDYTLRERKNTKFKFANSWETLFVVLLN